MPSYTSAVAFPPELLNENEEIVLDLRPHWLFLALPSATLVGVLIVAVLLLQWNLGFAETLSNYALVIGIIVVVAWLGWTYAKWSTTHFVLTTDRIINRAGIVSKRGVDIPLDRVNTVIFHQGLLERMVGAGDLTIESASETGANEFQNIRQPNIVQKEIHVQMEANENRKFDRRGAHQAPPPAAPVAKDASIPEQIEQLSALHQRGVLSDAEFARKKAELLDRM